MITMMTSKCMQTYGLNSLVIYFDVKTRDGGKHDNEEPDLN
jgi:hypothetical protein